MQDKEILERAITKAIDGGWKDLFTTDGYKLACEHYSYPYLYEFDEAHHINTIIFNHDFAKALWRYEKPVIIPGTMHDTLEAWQYHLQQMVIADDPIQYLGENI